MRGGLCSSRDGSRFSPETCAFAVLADGQPGHYHGITAAPNGGPGPGAISRALSCRGSASLLPGRHCPSRVHLSDGTGSGSHFHESRRAPKARRGHQANRVCGPVTWAARDPAGKEAPSSPLSWPALHSAPRLPRARASDDPEPSFLLEFLFVASNRHSLFQSCLSEMILVTWHRRQRPFLGVTLRLYSGSGCCAGSGGEDSVRRRIWSRGGPGRPGDMGGPSAHTRELGRVLALAKQVTRQTPG